ncbi:MAG: autotransporter outer membrane beta-barrel domain-containing protein [Pseudomonadota bacterium]
MKSKRPILNNRIILFAFIAALVSSGQVMAAACSSSVSPYAVDCDASGINWTSGSLSVNSGVTLLDSASFSFRTPGGSFTNNGSITNTRAGDIALVVGDGGAPINISNITNNGSMTGGQSAIQTFNSVTINTLSNSGALNAQYGLYFQSSNVIGDLINTGTITGTVSGIKFTGGTVTTITNTGTISGGIYNYDPFPFGIPRVSTIGTLINSQGMGNAAGALTYSGKLPSNYSIIINSPTSFGKLAVTSASGSTTFGIYAGSTVANGTYAAVISGLSAGNFTATAGTLGAGTWTLSNSSGSIWDLIISGYVVMPVGPSTANTQQSLVNTSQVLQGSYTLQNSVLANSFTYDCALFDKNNVCISAGGRNTAVSAANGLNNTSGLLIAAYRPHMNYRVGAYVDQNLSVNNAGSTVNLGNNTPLIGLFGAWNGRLDGTGAEVKVSAAYGQKNATVTRGVVGAGSTASEAGTGGSQLNSRGAQVVAKYGFGVAESAIVSPYAGIRYTQNNMGGYTESNSSAVTAPLTYSALNTNATTALAGVGASYRFIPQATAFASAGVETDTNTANGSYSATGVTGLTPVNFNANPVKTRPTAMVGATYDVEKNQRIGVTGIYRQEPYQAVSTTTVMATYTVGL